MKAARRSENDARGRPARESMRAVPWGSKRRGFLAVAKSLSPSMVNHDTQKNSDPMCILRKRRTGLRLLPC